MRTVFSIADVIAMAQAARGDRTTALGALLLGLAAALYLCLGLVFTVGNLLFPAALAAHRGYALTEHDVTSLIHLAAGSVALALTWVGVVGLRAWLHQQRYPRVFAAATALSAFSCMFGLMPTSETTVLTVLGVALMAVSMLAFLVVLSRA